MNLVVAIRTLVIFLLTFLVFSPFTYAANSIDGIRVWPAPENTRIVFDLKTTPEYTYFSLKNPQRLVIDFKYTKNLVELETLARNDKRIKRIRTSKPKYKGGMRLVLELNDDYKLTLFPLAPAGQYGNRLVVDLFDPHRVNQTVETHTPNDKRDIVIAVIAGHGGEDPGSIGASGTYEKHITLNIAKKLSRLIDRQTGFKAVMIRSGDYYVNHDRKIELSREKGADLLISIHADAFTSAQPHGASVLVQSTRRADSEFTRWISNRQKESELLGGAGDTIKKTKDKNLAITLADMKKEYTMASSYEFAEHVIKQMKKVTKLHKKTPERLSLAVLKSADIPSVLIETGFISNPQEEKRLNNSAHQQKLAKSIFTAITHYFELHPPQGSLIAAMTLKKHKVARGESLSVVAQRYNVSVNQLKSLNNLSSNVVRIGQTLKIPRAAL
ncbi:N-acetylmuramoyl-L-alanine amidase [Thalassotalea profundi]|uniref:N-acetylmuramoyl-L-alanine amidase n=1 Tax=Thalassotalea profundi TaxID=2036687 RepID=A0ABQ3J8L3_9GAMM|nr:N-acetylmuramoyl-L-alanine amidase [Thalassotalea profundi]GHF02210.1 N-acetylmuramoyl-L-alanine amidase [Thalassotalea profundi]